MFNRKEYNKEYYSRPEVKERQKEYYKEYYSRPEVKERHKKYMKEYLKEYQKEYYAKPEIKERQKEYYTKYYSIPEIKERQKENQYRLRSSIPGKLTSIKSRSKERNLEFNITLEYLESIYPDDSLCPLLNIPLDWNSPPKHPSTPSIDRIDNSKGYIKGNVQWVSWRANRLMSDATPDELLMVAQNYKKIYDQTILS